MLEKPGMTGQVFGTLIVSEWESLCFDQICKILDASKGSINGTTKPLVEIGLIEPVSLPGDRKAYYRITKTELGNIEKPAADVYKVFRELN